MEITIKKISELIDEKIIEEPMDGNHGEKHPKTSDYVKDGIPFILVPDLKNGKVDLENCNFITNEMSKKLSKGFAKTGDVLFTHKATIGKVAIVDTKQYDYIILTPQVTYYRILKENIINNKYLYYYFKSEFFQNTFKMYASSGGTRAYLGIVAQKKLPIIYPNIDCQRKIVNILSKYDELIENNNKRISILEQMAEEIYKEWFVRFRFPGYKKTEFENGIPNSFELVKLKDITKLKSGYAFKSNEFFENGKVCVAKIKDINDGIMDVTDFAFISNEDTIKKANKFKLIYGDLTIALTGATIGKIGIVPKYEKEIYTNQRLGKFFNGKEPIKKLPYLYVLFSQDSMRQMIYNVSGASAAQPNISPEQIENFKIITNKELIEKYNIKCYSIFKEILVLDEINKNLTKQRDLLLPRLMSGKFQVK